jgi:hypothetical protein
MSASAAVHRPLPRPRLADGLFGFVVLSTLAGIPLTLLSHQYFDGVVPLVIGLPSAVTGLLVARRQPRNPIGWLLLALAICLMFGNDGSDYVTLAYLLGYHLALGAAGLLVSQLWGPGIMLFGPVILLFPDGTLSSRWTRLALWVYVAVYVVAVMALAVETGVALAAHPIRVDISGGLAATDDPSGWYALMSHATELMAVVFMLVFVVRQALSWRTSSGERKQQLKWLACGCAAVPVGLVLAVLGSTNTAAGENILGGIGWLVVAALPVCIGVAILKYRLYDIERIISRTLSYAIVTGLLVGVYVGLVVLVTHVLGFTSQVGVAASTLAAAALFYPLRRRVQHLVDKRFNRARYDAERTIAEFAARLQDAVAVDAVRADLIGVISGSVEPAHVSLWLSRDHPER